MTTADLFSCVMSTFPGLRPADHSDWSDSSPIYNCIAWAAEDATQWWWPVAGHKPNYWPAVAPRELTIDAFIRAFQSIGYSVCNNRKHEHGFTKVALYVTRDARKKPTHMARQQPDGTWTSKLGEGPDVNHVDPECLEGDFYGRVAAVLRRPAVML